MTVDRYKAAISAALEIHRLKDEIQKNVDIIQESITVKEFRSKNYDNQAAIDALKILDNVQIEESQHVKAKLNYFEVEICLHCDPKINGSKAMGAILNELKI